MNFKFNRTNLVVSADDFGISQQANQRILELVAAKKVDRVAVLARGIFSAEEVEKLKASGVALDVHLESVIRPRNRKLKDSVLKRLILFVFRFFFGQTNGGVMELEWIKQIELFREKFGRYPDGINSHEYIHFFPAYFKIAVKLGDKFQIPHLRFGKAGITKGRGNVWRILRWLQKKDTTLFARAKAESADWIVSLDWIRNLKLFLTTLPEGKIEMITHPEREEEWQLIKKYF